jgi:outer membrane protein W
MKKLVYLAMCLAIFATITSAQTARVGKVGLGIDGVTSPNLAAKYFFTNEIAGELIVGTDMYFPGGDAPTGQTKVTGTDIWGGLSVLYHFTESDFTPYLGVEGLFETAKTGGFYVTEPDAKNSVTANIVFGGEYFFAKQFSVGVKEKVGMNFQLSRDIPKEETESYLKTGTQLTARFYFN